METKKLTPLFFFLSLGTVVALIVSVTALLNLSFETLNHAFPDVLTDSYQYGYANYNYDGVRSALSMLIIMFPVFLILERFWSKAFEKPDLTNWDAILRRWAIYLILFLASVTIITDLVILVKYFVSGEITTRFILKVILALIVALKVGWYYILKLKNKPVNILSGILASILVIAIIIWSFTVIGSPATQRSQRLDQRRIEDLQNIQWQIISYWQQKEKLPDTLADLANPLQGSVVPKDPEFQKGRLYEYKKNNDLSAQAGKQFELCASFDLPIPKGFVPGQKGGVYYPMTAMRDVAVSMPYPGGAGESWDHEAGRTCYQRTIDPEMYPPFPKPVKG